LSRSIPVLFRLMSAYIPFNHPGLFGRELDLMATALQSGRTAGGGKYSEAVCSLLANELGAAGVILTTSCTDALELASLLIGTGPGDVVIVPSFTFVSTALAFTRSGATIRFADIDPITLGISADTVVPLIDEKVRVIVPVHYAGVGVEIEPLLDLASTHGIDIVEDNAHGLFGTYMDKQLGTFGRLSTLSFHETKNFSCGEGGALVLNSVADIERANILCDKGTNRQAFLSGMTEQYTWIDDGSSFRLSDLLAAFLLGQLEHRADILNQRHKVTKTYQALLEPRSEELGYQCMSVPEGRNSSWHMYYVLLASQSERDHVLAEMTTNGVQATFHYVPLHSSPAGRAATDRSSNCHVTDDISGRLLRLPFFTSMTTSQVERVVEELHRALGG
jgi:dTDP-4-amino-4,6-dideoxygalactose transaminase